MLTRVNVSLALLLVVQAGLAATPEQIGTYVGTITGKNYQLDTLKPAPYKGPITIQINADNSYSFTLPEITISSGVNTYLGASHGVTYFNASGYHLNTSFHFKGSVLKGAVLYSNENGSSVSLSVEGKFTAKKQVVP